ncbi:MAG: hypothetical protein WC758_04095 [Candidatus Woesearchaeota archaeon]|jgi:ribulose-phosphate 3-epimerase
MKEIIPTVFTFDRVSFVKRLNKMSSASKKIQIDMCDGKFVPVKTLDLTLIPSFSKSKLTLEAHLMVEHPEKYIESLRRKGFKKVIFHIETIEENEFLRFVDRITALGMIPVVAINPETRITKKVLELISLTNFVLIMGVRPGLEHQKVIVSTFNRIKKIKKYSNKIIVQVDGGVNKKTAKSLFVAGADILNPGSYINDSLDPKKAILELLK